MTAFVTIVNSSTFVKEIKVGDKPTEKYRGVKPHMVTEIQLDGYELDYAINHLGAAYIKKSTATYYGDEARRIFFNW